jgi:hypothetical protein
MRHVGLQGAFGRDKKLKTWLLICSGGLNAKNIEFTETTSIYELFGLS